MDDSSSLIYDFRQQCGILNQIKPAYRRFPEDTFKAIERGVKADGVLTDYMLVNKVLEHQSGSPMRKSYTKVFLCYEWITRQEFILVRTHTEEKDTYYTPQYGRDDNYAESTRHDYEIGVFSIDAFIKERPALAEQIAAIRSRPQTTAISPSTSP